MDRGVDGKMASDQLTELLHLQRLVDHASKPEFTSTNLKEMTQDDLIVYLQLENVNDEIMVRGFNHIL